jgi:hypothetical protein
LRVSGFKWVNSWDRIHSFKLGYDLDIQRGCGTKIYQIMAVSPNHVFLLQDDDITGFLGTEKPLIRWSNMQF